MIIIDFLDEYKSRPLLPPVLFSEVKRTVWIAIKASFIFSDDSAMAIDSD